MAASINDVHLLKDTNFTQNELTTELNPLFTFPIEFPYEFDSFGSSSSSLTSLVDSESSDEDEFLVRLTGRLTQQLAGEPKNSAGSPKSILSGIGSWSMSSNSSTHGDVSPPATPFAAKNDICDLIYFAAGDVARSNYHRRGLLGPANGVRIQSTGFYTNQRFVHGVSLLNQRGRAGFSGYENGRSACVLPLGLPQSAWPPLQSRQNKHHFTPPIATGGFGGGSGGKRGCTGTGVFLPRRYEHAHTDNKKSAKISQPFNLKLEDLNRQIKNNTQQSLKFSLASNHDGSRNGQLAQQKGNLQPESAIKNEICLPQEWIY